MVVIIKSIRFHSILHNYYFIWLVLYTIVGYKSSLVKCEQQEHPNQFDRFQRKFLNVRCDWSITGGGCYLRESYCSSNTCICKPDHPINIADRMCVSRYKTIDEQCSFSQECQPGSYCASVDNKHLCQCKTGYVYSAKYKFCTKGTFGSACKMDSDCVKDNLFCELSNTCQCQYGYQWDPIDEACYRRSKYGEPCEQSINCKLYDEFSDCDPYSKQCICGQFLSRKYALDEVTNKCIACPSDRYHNKTNTCVPEKMTVNYDNNSRQYVYIIFCMSPFIVVAFIGFIYGYLNPSATFHHENILSGSVFYIESPHLSRLDSQTNTVIDYCLQVNADTMPQYPINSESPLNLCLLSNGPDPPPTYDSAAQDLPPSYDEAIQQNV